MGQSVRIETASTDRSRERPCARGSAARATPDERLKTPVPALTRARRQCANATAASRQRSLLRTAANHPQAVTTRPNSLSSIAWYPAMASITRSSIARKTALPTRTTDCRARSRTSNAHQCDQPAHEQRRTTRRAPRMLLDWCNQRGAWRASWRAVTIRRKVLLRRRPALMSRRACGAGRPEVECRAHERPRAREGARRSQTPSRTCSQTRTGEPSAEPPRSPGG